MRLKPTEYPSSHLSFSKRVESTIELECGLSFLGYCRNMTVSTEEASQFKDT